MSSPATRKSNEGAGLPFFTAVLQRPRRQSGKGNQVRKATGMEAKPQSCHPAETSNPLGWIKKSKAHKTGITVQ